FAAGRAPTSHRPGSTDAARAPAAGSFIGRTSYRGAVSADAGEQNTAHPAAAAASPISFRTRLLPQIRPQGRATLDTFQTARLRSERTATTGGRGRYDGRRPPCSALGARSSVDRALASGARGH